MNIGFKAQSFIQSLLTMANVMTDHRPPVQVHASWVPIVTTVVPFTYVVPHLFRRLHLHRRLRRVLLSVLPLRTLGSTSVYIGPIVMAVPNASSRHRRHRRHRRACRLHRLRRFRRRLLFLRTLRPLHRRHCCHRRRCLLLHHHRTHTSVS